MSDNPWPEILVIGGTMYAIYIVLKLVVWLFVGTKTVVGATIEHGPSATAKALDAAADIAGHAAGKVDHARH